MKTKSFNDLFVFLEKQNKQDLSSQLITASKQESAHYANVIVKGLLAIGAFIASGFLIALLGLILKDVFNIHLEKIAGVAGIVFILFALLVRYRKKSETLGDFFIRMISLMFMISGKGLAIYGLADFIGGLEHSTPWKVTFAIFVVSAITYVIYDVFVDRFLGGFVFGVALLLSLFDAFEVSKVLKPPYDWMIVHGIFFACGMCLLMFLGLYGRLKHVVSPLFYALIAVLTFDLIAMPMIEDVVKNNALSYAFLKDGLLKISICISLMVLIQFALKRYQSMIANPNLFNKIRGLVIVFAIVISLVTTPLVSFALLCLCLGFALFKPIIIAGAAITLPYGLIRYYYDLHISLFAKSFVLMASGLLLLAMFVYMKKQGWASHD